MANEHARRFKVIPDCELVAACDVDASRVAKFASAHGILATFTDLDRFLAEGDFEAVANVTPDRFHAPISIASLKAGKHVLCEKPLANNYADAAKMVRAADKAGTINMVNFSYRNSSAIQEAARLVAAGVLGPIRHVEGSYLQDWLSTDHWGHWKTNPTWLWRLSTSHGSKGVLGDVGVHLLDFASFPIGRLTSVHCLLKTFPKVPRNKVGEYTLDANDTALITATFEGGAVGVLDTTRWATGHRNRVALSIFGEEGAIKIDLERSDSAFEWCKVKKRMAGPWQTVEAKPTPSIYERFITSIRTGKKDQPDFARGAEIQKALDACEKSHQTGRAVGI
ncbi:MAG: Gfo/Idh/MocA family oxidoreductase [Candidatus Methylacidiphilales bacterium]